MIVDDAPAGALTTAILAAIRDESCREALYRALLVEPVFLLQVGPDAPVGPAVKLGGDANATRLIEAPALRVPVVPLFASGQALRAAAAERALWPDAVERSVVVEPGKIFPLLRGHPGVLAVADEQHLLPLDAGDVAALAERQTPEEYLAALRALITRGRAREVARKLATRSLYILGHPRGGMLMVQRDLPAFLHLASAERFAARIAAQTGERAEHGLVAASDLFKHAWTGKLNVLINPGPGSIALRSIDLR